MNIWHQYPFVRIYLAFSAGIAMAIAVGTEDFLWFPALSIILFAVFLTGINLKWSQGHRWRWVFGFLVNAFFILIGFNLLILKKESLFADHFNGIKYKKAIIALVNEPPVVKENICKMILQVKAIETKDGFQLAGGKIMAYFSKDSLSAGLHYGDLLIIGAIPQQVEGPRNPGSFDYQRYLAANNVYHQVFLHKNQWLKIDSGQGHMIIAMAVKIRDKFLSIFRENGISGREYAVASALILGSSDLLDPETRREYAGSGAMHILSVSGMHVAVIFVVLNTLLVFMDKRRGMKIAKAVLLIFCIWFYAAITGLSPAVLRAAWMISLVIIGSTWRRQANIYNVLAASAMLITLADPMIIINTGFQLSYIAVLGIVAIEPWIYRLWSPRWRIMDWIWKIVAVSIAAQVATFPLALYYFHQFANYFLITNLVAIPVSAFVIYSGIGVLVTSPVPLISGLLAKAMTGLLIVLNSSIRFIEQAPGSVSRDVPFSVLMMLMIYLLIYSLFRLWVNKKKIYLFLSFTIMFLIAILNLIDDSKWQKQSQFVVYSVKNHTSFCFVFGRQAVIFSDSAVASDSMLMSYTMRPHWVSSALKKIEIKMIGNTTARPKQVRLLDGICVYKGNYFQFGKTRIALLIKKTVTKHKGAKLNVDYLIIRNIKGLRIADLCNEYSAGEFIFDSSLPKWKCLKLQKECLQLGQKCYAVPIAGAFVSEFD
jgi:competence protein ComEC